MREERRERERLDAREQDKLVEDRREKERDEWHRQLLIQLRESQPAVP